MKLVSHEIYCISSMDFYFYVMYRLTFERVVSWWVVSKKIFSLKEIFFTVNIILSSEEMYVQKNKIKPRQTVGSKLTHQTTKVLL